MIEIPEAEYASLVSRLSTNGGLEPELLHQVLAWQLEPVSRPLKRLGEQAQQLARRLDKGELSVVIESNAVRLDPDSWSPFFAELIHVIRNAVDHGIESPEEREASGKPRSGTLVLKALVSATTLAFEVGDDGRGIDWDAVARSATARNLPHGNQSELFDALVSDGVTTRSRVNGVSGRGVGLAAVNQRVVAMGGKLEVRSVRGVGTSWLIRFPWSPHEIPTVKSQRGEDMASRRGAAVRGPRAGV
jgi:two-component system chemotaxis sensor kinase CheA